MNFGEWLDQQDIALGRWEPVADYDLFGNESHHHELTPFTPEETDIILERYLRNVRKIYGDMPAAHICVHDCPLAHHEIPQDVIDEAKRRLEEIRKNKPQGRWRDGTAPVPPEWKLGKDHERDKPL